MGWSIESCIEENGDEVVVSEFLAFNDTDELAAARLLSWLVLVSNGDASPSNEPSESFDGCTLHYRIDGGLVLIFCLDAGVVLTLRVARAQNYPLSSDMRLAAARARRRS